MTDITIGQRKIGRNHDPFIIAEMSGNHNGSLERAIAIVDAAAEAGAHAIKLQSYTPDSMTFPRAYVISDKNSPWYGRDLYDLYHEANTPYSWHEVIFKRANEKKIICFSSPFDEIAVDLLGSLNSPAYKIASFENTDIALLRKVAKTGKPVILSSGVSTMKELEKSVAILRRSGCKKLILLKCTSAYPTDASASNLLTIPMLSKKFRCPVGLSDHTTGIGVALAAVALGAAVIEKHFTLDRSDGGVDSAFSIEPDELKTLVIESKKAFASVGTSRFGISEAEKNSLIFKRSLYAVKDIEKGEKFTKQNIRAMRPALGLPSLELDNIIGKRSAVKIGRGVPLKKNMISHKK